MSDVVEAERYLHLMRRMGTPEQIEERAKAVDRIMIEMPRIEAKLDTLINRTSSRMWQVTLMLMPIVGAGLIAWGTLKAEVGGLRNDQVELQADVTAIGAAFDAQIQRRNAQMEVLSDRIGATREQNAGLVGDVTATRALVERIDRRLEQLESKLP